MRMLRRIFISFIIVLIFAPFSHSYDPGYYPSGAGGNGDPNPPCPPSSPPKAAPDSPAAPSWSVNMVNFNLYMGDTPLWYNPPIGPKVAIGLSYNSKGQVASDSLVGNKWQLNYQSFLEVDAVSGKVTVTLPDGGKKVFVPDGTGGYTRPYLAFYDLVPVGANQFELRFQDGGSFSYTFYNSITTKTYISAMTDAYGQSITFAYNGAELDQLATITDAVGNVTTLTYGGGLLQSVSDPFGRSTSFEYHPNGDLQKITDMGGYWTSFEYAENSYLSAIINAGGRTEFYIEPAETVARNIPYPEPGTAMGYNYRITVTHPDGGKEEFYYHSVSSPYGWHISPKHYTEYSPTLNNSSASVPKTIYTYANTVKGIREEIASITYPNGLKTVYTYDYYTGLRLSRADAASNTSRWTYNANAQILTSTRPNGTVSTKVYAPNNIDPESIEVKDALGNVLGASHLTWTATHDVQTYTNKQNKTTAYQYNSYGQLRLITDPLNVVTELIYDPDTLYLSQVKRDGKTLSNLTYDNKGRLQSGQEPDGMVYNFGYDDLDHLTSVTFPDNKSIVYRYESPHSPHLLTSITDRGGRTTNTEYYPDGNIARMVNPNQEVQRFLYDPNGNLEQFIDPDTAITRFEYDKGDRLTRKIYPNGGAESMTYHPSGKPWVITNSRNQTTTYYWDANGNIAAIDYSDTSPDVFYTFDPFDRLQQVEDGTGITLFTYDAENRLLTYGYDDLDRRTLLQPQGGQAVSYGYDSLNRLRTITAGAGVFGYDYVDEVSPLIQTLTRPNGSVTGYQYDPVLKTVLTQVDNATSADNLISRFDYTYNAQDLIESESIAGLISLPSFQEGLTEYDYNDLNQLLSSTENSQSFTYDPDGNMLTGYTPEGQPLTAAYDAANRLTSVEFQDAQSTLHRNEYAYNWTSFLARIKQFENGNLVNEVKIIRSDRLAIQERDGSNVTTGEYVWGLNLGGGIGGLLLHRRGGSDYTYQYDGRGNISSLLDSSEAVVASYRYDEFGRLLAMAGSFQQPFQYSTKRCDQNTGLVYYGYRFYAPAIGRWMNRDPLGEAGGINLYGFVLNNPIMFVDPEGLKTWQIGLGFNSGGLVGSTKSAGIIIGHNPSTGNWDFGFYTTGGAGLYGGASASLTLDVTTSDNPCIDDVSGWAGTAGGSVGEVLTGGYERNTPMSNALPSNTYSFGVGAGTPAEGHGFATYTNVWGSNK